MNGAPHIPQTGEKCHSEFFGGTIILTRYFNDAHWYFYRANDPEKEELRAQTPWSKMPKEPT